MNKVNLLKFVLTAAVSAFAAMCLFADADEAGDEWYAGGAAQILMPQGGSSVGRLGGAAARGGRYFGRSFAVECEGAMLENSATLAARAVWHLNGWREFDMLFGCERFDPFLSAGAKGLIHDGQVGPFAGIGAFFHLTDYWALRLDADAMLGLDTEAKMLYTVSLGIQRFF